MPEELPCPELVHHDGRYWCGILEKATGPERKRLTKELAIGAGCCSPLFNRDRDELLRRARGI